MESRQCITLQFGNASNSVASRVWHQMACAAELDDGCDSLSTFCSIRNDGTFYPRTAIFYDSMPDTQRSIDILFPRSNISKSETIDAGTERVTRTLPITKRHLQNHGINVKDDDAIDVSLRPQVLFDRKSFLCMRQLSHTNAGVDVVTRGMGICDSNLMEMKMDSIRHFMEECDNIDAFCVYVDVNSPWNSFAHDVLDELRDESPKSRSVVFGIEGLGVSMLSAAPGTRLLSNNPGIMNDISKSDQRAYATNMMYSLSRIPDNCCYVPLCFPTQYCISPPSSYDVFDPNVAAGLYAAAIDSALLPVYSSRIPRFSGSISYSLMAFVNFMCPTPRTPLAGMMIEQPIPVANGGDAVKFAQEFESVYSKKQHPLSSYLSLSAPVQHDDDITCVSQCLVMRGLGPNTYSTYVHRCIESHIKSLKSTYLVACAHPLPLLSSSRFVPPYRHMHDSIVNKFSAVPSTRATPTSGAVYTHNSSVLLKYVEDTLSWKQMMATSNQITADDMKEMNENVMKLHSAYTELRDGVDDNM